jgi:hypothetical protein
MPRVEGLTVTLQAPFLPPDASRVAIYNRYTLTIRIARKSLKTLIGGTV